MIGENPIPVMKSSPPWVEGVESRLREIWSSQQFSNFGPQNTLLEAEFARKLGVCPEKVVSATNATLALVGAMSVSDARNWAIPSWTFAATAHAAVASGGKVRFLDVDESSWRADTDHSFREGEGLVLVLPFGAGLEKCNWSNDQEIVIDGAASLGASLPQLDSLPDKASIVFSLHATKVFGVGEGALAVFGDVRRANRFRRWANFGFNDERTALKVGSNAKMSEITAGVLRLQLDHWDLILRGWRSARLLMNSMAESVNVTTFQPIKNEVSPYFIAIFEDEKERNFVEQRLASNGISSRRWWLNGCHQMPAFSRIPHRQLIVTESLAGRYLGLPFFTEISEPQAERIFRVLAER
jgi:dTDP-4-amino-4,6-dideoxygalactose transaminase